MTNNLEETITPPEPTTERVRLVETIVALSLGPEGLALLATRPETFTAMETSYRSLLHPENPGVLSYAERAFLAFQVASLVPHVQLASVYREDLAAAEDNVKPSLLDIKDDELSPRLGLMLRYLKTSTLKPQQITPVHIAELAAAGLDNHAIVSLSQIIAFVSYQARVLLGLNIWKGNS